MKKIFSVLVAVAMSVALFIPAHAENQNIASYEIVKGQNFCTGTFENVKTGALPQKGSNKELSATQGWRSNEYDYQTVSIVNKGYKGGNCLQIAGNGTNAYGAAYYIFPEGNIKRGETYEVTFMYKVTDPLTKTNQLHCDVMDGGVGETHTIIAGLAPIPGEVLEDGWRRVSGTFVVEAPGTFKAIRFFAEFLSSGKTLGSEANILIDNVEIAKLTAKSVAAKNVNLSSTNLVAGGDFEYREPNKFYDTSFDPNGWWVLDGEIMASTVVNENNNKALKIAGNMMLNYGSVYVNFQEKMTAGKTYRLIFDYKFLGKTKENTAQAHVAFMSDADLQIGNPGGWGNVNLVVNDLGVAQSNGYKRVAVDFTPNSFQADAIYGLRFFINLAQQPSTFGIMFDNVRVSEVGAASSGNNQNTNTGTSDEPSGNNDGNISGNEDVSGESSDISSDEPADMTSSDETEFGDSLETDAENSENSDSSDSESNEGGSLLWLWIVLIVVVLGGGGFSLWYFVIRKKINNNKAE